MTDIPATASAARALRDDVLRADALAAAAAICTRLAASAVPAVGGLSWRAEIIVGVEQDAPVLGHGEVGPSLYDGTAGIALVLSALAADVPSPLGDELTTTARGAAHHALAGAEQMLAAGTLGYWEGACGIAHAVAVVARHLEDAALRGASIRLATAVAEKAAAAATADLTPGTVHRSADLIGGDAGVALGLVMLAAELDLDPLRAVARILADRLVDAARPQLWGAAWPSPLAPEEPPLLGLAHGAAGIALGLAEVAALDPGSATEHLAAAAHAGLEYERSWYERDRRAWPDLREGVAGAPGGWMSAWCHGALGIGLSRLRLGALTPSPRLDAEATAALQAGRDVVVRAGTALRRGAPTDCSACHGLTGALELFTVAARRFSAPEHAAAARSVSALLLAERELVGAWPCGLPGAGEVPGLMTGTAGIALALARAVDATAEPTPLLPGTSRW